MKTEHIVWVDGVPIPFDEYMKTIGPAEAKRAAELHESLQRYAKTKGHDMKVSFYFDTYPNQELKYIFPTQTPGKKADNVTRYKVTVEIPDPIDAGTDTEVFPIAEKINDDEQTKA